MSVADAVFVVVSESGRETDVTMEMTLEGTQKLELVAVEVLLFEAEIDEVMIPLEPSIGCVSQLDVALIPVESVLVVDVNTMLELTNMEEVGPNEGNDSMSVGMLTVTVLELLSTADVKLGMTGVDGVGLNVGNDSTSVRVLTVPEDEMFGKEDEKLEMTRVVTVGPKVGNDSTSVELLIVAEFEPVDTTDVTLGMACVVGVGPNVGIDSRSVGVLNVAELVLVSTVEITLEATLVVEPSVGNDSKSEIVLVLV
jgi:hypothetical protein